MLTAEWVRERLSKLTRIRDLENEAGILQNRIDGLRIHLDTAIRMIHEYLEVEVVPPRSKLEKKRDESPR